MFECKKCGRNYRLKEYLRKHEKVCNSILERYPKEKCPKCSDFITSRQIKKHLKTCKGLARISQSRGKNWIKGKTYEEVYGKERAILIKLKIKKSIGKFFPIKDEDKEKWKKNISEGQKRAYKEGRSKGWIHRDSYAEKFFEKFFSDLGYEKGKDFLREYKIEKYRADFLFPNLNLIIEIDGAQHYRFQEFIQKDKIRDARLKELGFETIRIPWVLVRNNDWSILKQIEELVKNKLQSKDFESAIAKTKNEYEQKKLSKQKRKQQVKYQRELEIQGGIQRRLDFLKSIDMSKRGCISKISKNWGISHTSVRRFIKKYSS